MAFIFNDRNNYYDILRAHSGQDALVNHYKFMIEQNDQVVKDQEIYAEKFPEIPAAEAAGLSLLGIPPEYNAVKEIAQEISTARIHNEAKLWKEMQEKYRYEHLEDNMKMSIGDLLTGGLFPGGTKPGDVQYGVWAFAALDAFFQTVGPSGKWSVIASGVNALLPGQPMKVGRSQAYLRDLKAYDKLVRDGFTPAQAQNQLQIDLSGAAVANLGEDVLGGDALRKQIDMVQEAHRMGGEPVLANMWRNVVQGKPLNFDRATKITMESVKAENTPYYVDLVNNYGLSPEEASDFVYRHIGEPLKTFDENGEIHYTSAYNPNKVNFYAGRARQRYFWAGQSHQDYYRPDWANKDILLEYSPGKVTAAEVYEPGSKAFDILSGTTDFVYQLAPEIFAGKGIKGTRNLFRGMRGSNKAFDLMQTGRIKQTGKSIKISPRKMADDLMDEIADEIDGTNDFSDISKHTNRFGFWKKTDDISVDRRSVKKSLKKIKRENTLFGRVPRFFQETQDDILSRPENLRLWESLADTTTDDIFFLATNPVTRILPPQVQAQIIKESDPVMIQRMFGDMIGTGIKITDEAGQLVPYKLPDGLLPKTGSLVLNKVLRQTGINQNAQYRTFGSWAGEKSRKVRQTLVGRRTKSLVRVEDGVEEIVDKMDEIGEATYKYGLDYTYKQNVLNKIDAGELPDFERYLGFSSNFNSTYDPYYRKLLSVVPDMGIPLNNLQVGYKQLASHLQINKYDPTESSKILEEFIDLDFMDKSAIRSFTQRQKDRDIARVKARGGNWEYVAFAAKDMFSGQQKSKIYGTAFGRRVLPGIGTNFKGYQLDELGRAVDDKGQLVTSMTANLFTEMQDNIAPLVDYRLLEKAMGGWFRPYKFTPEGVFTKDKYQFNLKDIKQFKKYISPFDETGINPLAEGVISTKRLEQSFLSNMASYYTRNIFKPLVLLRGAFFTRVFLEESARIATRGLAGAFNKPHEFIIWLSAHNPDSKLGKAIERLGIKKGAKYNKDAVQFMMEEEFLEATQRTARFQDMGGPRERGYKNRDLEYIGKSTSEMEIDDIAESVYQELRLLRTDPLQKAVAKYGYGTDELAEWLASPAGREARLQMVKNGGSEFRGILDDASVLLDQHLQMLESRARITSGGVVSDGIDLIKQSDGTYKYQLRTDVHTGNKHIRNMIANGELKKYASDETLEFFSSEVNLINKFSKRKIIDELKQYYNKTDGIDPGTLTVARPMKEMDSKKGLAQLEEVWDHFLQGAFDRLITKPIGYLNRSSTFKQFRWMYIGNRFEDFTPRLRKQFIDEAIDAAVPKSLIDELKGSSLLYKPGKIDDYAAMNTESKAYGLAGVKELLYDTRQRHAISDKLVNIFPFAEVWFEVFQTWGKLLAQNPYAIRKGHVGVRGATGADALGPSSDEGFFAPDPRDPQRDVFVYPFGGWMSNLIFDDENVGGEQGVQISPRVQVQGVNLLAQGFVPGPNPFVAFGINRLLPKIETASTKAGAKYGWANDLEKFIFGNFPPPETASEVFGASPVWTKLGAWLKDPDDFDIISDSSSESEKMRARTTIDLWRWGVSAGEPERLYNDGKLDSYLSKLYPGQSINNVNQGQIEDAYLEYAKEKSGTLFAFQFIAQMFGPAGFKPEYFVEDEQGHLYGQAVLYEEFLRIKQKNGDDDIATYNEFLELYGIEHPYLMSPKSQYEVGKKPSSVRVQEFQANNKEIFDTLDVSGYYLNIDNPNEEKDWHDIVREKNTLSPDQYRRNVNDTIGFFRYKTFVRKIDEFPLESLQKTLIKRTKREALKLELPGFQADEYGLLAPPSTQDIFDEMLEHWTINPAIKEFDSAKGFNEALVYWKEAEELSISYSPTGSDTWWLTSDDPRAKTLRIWMYNKANGIIEKNPEFWPVWTGVMLKLYRDDNEYLEYLPEG